VPVWLPGEAARSFRTGADLASERTVGHLSWEEFLAERLTQPHPTRRHIFGLSLSVEWPLFTQAHGSKEFRAFCIQNRACNAASSPKGSILEAATLDDQLLHVVVLDRYTGSGCARH
jgi:hypothetical protein